MPRAIPPTADPRSLTDPVTDTPMYWFAKLEFAIADSDLTAAAEAQRQLKRLGIIVRYQFRGPRLAEEVAGV